MVFRNPASLSSLPVVCEVTTQDRPVSSSSSSSLHELNLQAIFDCQAHSDAKTATCGGHPPLENILDDNTTYAAFTSQANIDTVCAALQTAYQNPWIRGYDGSIPSMIELCQMQRQVKHFCSGFCEGTCFQDEPSSCTANVTNVTSNIDHFSVCSEIGGKAFVGAESSQIFRVETHSEYMKTINDTFCPLVKEA